MWCGAYSCSQLTLSGITKHVEFSSSRRNLLIINYDDNPRIFSEPFMVMQNHLLTHHMQAVSGWE